MICSIAPDIDAVGYHYGVPYAATFGHRGATHSLAFALVLGVVCLAIAPALKTSRVTALWFTTLCAVSHPVLDALTFSQRGVAFFWPFMDKRYQFPVQVFDAAPLNLHRFFSPVGWNVLRAELMWIWLPSAIVALLLIAVRGLFHVSFRVVSAEKRHSA